MFTFHIIIGCQSSDSAAKDELPMDGDAFSQNVHLNVLALAHGLVTARVRLRGERGLVEPGGAGARDGDGGHPLETHQHLHPLRHDHRPGLHMGLPSPRRSYINTLYYTSAVHKHPVLRPLDHSGQGPRNININIKIG